MIESGDTSSDRAEPLTPSETRVLELVAEDYTNAEIATALVCSAETVKSHVHRILEKLQVTTRREAARRYRSKDHPFGQE